MKKLIVISIILGFLVVANIIIKNEDSRSKINMPSLAQAISLELSISNYKIIND